MATVCEQTLAAGLWSGGACHRRAVLRALDVSERSALLDEHASSLPAERVTAVLAAALGSIGELEPVTAEDVRDLTVGDRDRLVLALRRLLHGDPLECVFGCACGEWLEHTLSVSALLAGCEVDQLPVQLISRTGAGADVTVRPATGADHERAAVLARLDPAAAREQLLRACVIEAPGADDPEVRAVAEALLADHDPATEIVLDGDCPACGARVSAAIDPIAHLWAELERSQALLESEIHTLALHYHWSEPEIVALPPARRARYIARLNDQLARP